jgi:hypothetical protein
LRARSFQTSTDFTVVDVGFFGRRKGTRRRWSKVPYFTRDRDRNFRRAESERGSIEQQHLKTLDNLASFCQNFTFSICSILSNSRSITFA